ncbi:MAG: N(4)-(beta-N-acetylglucosaminyl)-L-asparaginase [Planctomycetes bacterium]|nr:N(4)-(beta-N-acetylglucosaminyl)-L-asparaginase [Planctomycetota bacterium]
MKVIASHNGINAAAHSFGLLSSSTTPLDAVVEGVTLVEDDPDELTVGYGGLPNEDGVVELDAAVMDGRIHRGGAVACLRNVRHATKVARLVMEQTNRVLLAGEGALKFALANGFHEENLLTNRARQMWLYWKRTRSSHDDWKTPTAEDADLDVQRWFEKHFYGMVDREGSKVDQQIDEITGTVHCAAIDGNGDMACATSTSGHAFKMAGRVGDSPILGAGLYVDSDAGSCGSIGQGEVNLENLTSYAAVELMRCGASPLDAGLEILQRVAKKAHPEQCDDAGRPKYNLQLFLLAKSGEHAGVSLWPGKQLAVADQDGVRLESCTPLEE